jgi:hypothetical protein
LRAERAGQIWSYAIVEAEAYDGRRFKVMAVIDEFTHECLTIRVLRDQVSETGVLADLFGRRGRPEHVHPDRAVPESAVRLVRDWLTRSGGKTDLVEADALAGTAFVQRLVSKLRGELIAAQAFGSPGEAQSAFDGWMRRHNGTLRAIASPAPAPAPAPAAAPRRAPSRPSYRAYGARDYDYEGQGGYAPWRRAPSYPGRWSRYPY